MLPIKKHELINIIQDLQTFSSPKLKFEQYITDPVATADLFYYMAIEQRDLMGHILIDFGCGPGNLSVAGALMGAEHIFAIDIDSQVLEICQENLTRLGIQDQVTLINMDITSPEFIPNITAQIRNIQSEGQSIVGVSNPPFGVYNRGVDVKFVAQALHVVDVLYSIHLQSEKSRKFLEQKIPQVGGKITNLASLALMLKHTYKHQKKNRKMIQTDVYRIISTSSKQKEKKMNGNSFF